MWQELTKKYEGWRGKPYTDTQGHGTIGWGFRMADPYYKGLISPEVMSGSRELSQSEAEPIFLKRYTSAEQDARKFIGEDTFSKLSDEDKFILTDMAYNMGLSRLMQFKKMRKAIQAGDLDKAADELRNSLYFRQVGNRGKENYQRLLK